MFIRWETKKRIWIISTVRWTWWPDICNQSPDTWSFWWGCFSIEYLSKEWLDFCEEHGGGLESTFEWLLNELEKEEEEQKE